MPKKTQHSSRNEIIWNLVNSALAGSLVMLGAYSTGQTMTWESFGFAFVAGAAVFVAQFKKFWETEEKDICSSTSKIFRVF